MASLMTSLTIAKQGANAAQLADWSHRVGWKLLLNTRGTTWRKLAEEDRAIDDEAGR
jgi:arsenate reductase